MTPGPFLAEAIPKPACCHSEPSESEERFLYIYLDLYNKCNLRCTMCTAHSPDESPAVIDQQAFQALAAKAFPIARQLVLSCSYEPLMFKGFFDYLNIASQFGIPDMTLTTNATLLTPDKSEKIISSGLTRIHISVDGATKKTYETIRKPANFEVLLENLGYLSALIKARKRGPKIQFQFVLMPENSRELIDFIDKFSVFRPQRFLFIHQDFRLPPDELGARMGELLRAALRACVDRQIMFGEFPEFYIHPDEIVRAYGGDETMPKMWAGCTDPWSFLAIKPNGDVFVCPHHHKPAGNLAQTDVASIWNGVVASQLRQELNTDSPPAMCQACCYSNQGVVQILRSYEQMEKTLERLIDQACKETN